MPKNKVPDKEKRESTTENKTSRIIQWFSNFSYHIPLGQKISYFIYLKNHHLPMEFIGISNFEENGLTF